MTRASPSTQPGKSAQKKREAQFANTFRAEVHADLCGRPPTLSFRGRSYYAAHATLTGDHTLAALVDHHGLYGRHARSTT